MDIVTHAAMGVILAAPTFAEAPLPSAGFALGMTLPDLDALSRIGGKLTFLRWHQTYTHALPLIAVATTIAWLSLIPLGREFQWTALTIGLGMASHALLDLTNTYGVKLLYPFSRRRYCLEWVFFIDATVICASAVALASIWSTWLSPWKISGSYLAVLVLYWLLHAVLRTRAQRVSPADTYSLMPSAVCPWLYFGCRPTPDGVEQFRVNTITGRIHSVTVKPILDARYASLIENLPEFHIMRELSPAYHVVSDEVQNSGRRLTCRDLRLMNFNTTFGQLDLTLDDQGSVIAKMLHV